jgi:hypothetical protein
LNTARASFASASMTGREKGGAISSPGRGQPGQRGAPKLRNAFEHEGVRDEPQFHVGDTRPERLIA